MIFRTSLQYCQFCFGWHEVQYHHIEEENRDYTKCTNCGNTHDLTRQSEICNEIRKLTEVASE